jgi:hypothetical protein
MRRGKKVTSETIVWQVYVRKGNGLGVDKVQLDPGSWLEKSRVVYI